MVFNFLKRRKKGDKAIIIFCDRNDLYEILSEVNMLTANYNITIKTIEEENITKKLKEVV